jgi:uncharacterized phosphosugar-binding protein
MSTPVFETYFNGILAQMKAVMENELEKIDQAAHWMAEAVKKDQLIHVYGTGGHNFMIACELFRRAGSLLNYNLILPPGTACFDGHPSTENIPAIVPKAFDYYRVHAGEVMLIINVNGINGTTIESALECRKRGLKSIGISSSQFAENVEPDCANRHPSGKNLHELVDLHLDCYTPVGDMIVDLNKIKRKTGASSTCPLVLISQLLNIRTIELLTEQGFTPDFFMSGNTKKGRPFGNKLKDKWIDRIKHM